MFSTTSDCMSVQLESIISQHSCQWDDLSCHYWHWGGRTPGNSVFLEGIYVALPQWIHFFCGKIDGLVTNNVLCFYRKPSHHAWPCGWSTQDLWHYTGDSSLTFKDLLVDFLKGTGIPCPQLFSQAQVHFGNIDVDLVDHNFYQPRVFCCTTTGSYDLKCGDLSLSVCISSHYSNLQSV